MIRQIRVGDTLLVKSGGEGEKTTENKIHLGPVEVQLKLKLVSAVWLFAVQLENKRKSIKKYNNTINLDYLYFICIYELPSSAQFLQR